jgi:hypothetical protein
MEGMLTIEDFGFLQRGMSLREIVNYLERDQDGVRGFNILFPFYELDSGTLSLRFDPPFTSDFEYLLYYIVDFHDGRKKVVDLE